MITVLKKGTEGALTKVTGKYLKGAAIKYNYKLIFHIIGDITYRFVKHTVTAHSNTGGLMDN